jgi:glucose/arabinose dehydrogenase
MRGARASGDYEIFLSGFVTAGGDVWGRPVGVAVANDGALLVSDDGSNSVWRVTYGGANAKQTNAKQTNAKQTNAKQK